MGNPSQGRSRREGFPTSNWIGCQMKVAKMKRRKYDIDKNDVFFGFASVCITTFFLILWFKFFWVPLKTPSWASTTAFKLSPYVYRRVY